MNFASQFDNVVKEMIGMAGGKGTLRIFTNGSYVDGEITRTYTDYTANIAMNDFPQANSGEKSKYGSLIQSDDKEIFIQPYEKSSCDCDEDTVVSIQANRDLIIVNNIEWKILALKEVNPSGVNVILYTAHLRR